MDLPEITDGKTIQRLLVGQKLHGSCCNKLVKAEFCKSIAFHPQDIYLSEDELYNIRLLNQNIKVCYIPKALYHYRANNQQSLCHSNDKKVIISKTRIEYFSSIISPSFINFKRPKKVYKEIHLQ